jgi:hypothetical protein
LSVCVTNGFITLMLPLDQNSIATASSRIASCTQQRENQHDLLHSN